MLRLLLLQPEAQRLPHCLGAGNPPLPAVGIELITLRFRQIHDSAHGDNAI
jgi:hypothetical protein